MSKKKAYSFKLFLLVLPFIILVLLFSYYPLYGWMYAFYDYKPPKALANCPFVGFKWFASLVSSQTKIDLCYERTYSRNQLASDDICSISQ